MSSVNRVTLVGRLGADPEARYMPNGKAVTNLSIATSEKWKDKQSGDLQERTEWHTVVCFDRLGEIAAEYLKKGSQAYVEGQLRTEKYEKDGVTHYRTKVVARELVLIGSRSSNESAPAAKPAAKKPNSRAPVSAADVDDTDAGLDFDDDIPF